MTGVKWNGGEKENQYRSCHSVTLIDDCVG